MRYTLWFPLFLPSLTAGCRFGADPEATEAPSVVYGRLCQEIEQIVREREEETLRGRRRQPTEGPLTPAQGKPSQAAVKWEDEVAAAGEKWVQEHPREEAADNCLYQLALLHRYERGEPEAARDCLARLRRDYPQSDVLPRALFEEGSLALDAADFPAARATFQQLQQAQPPPAWAARAWLGLAAAERSRKQYEAAGAAYRAFLENHAADGAASQVLRRWVEMGLDEQGNPRAAADPFLEFAARYPHSRPLGRLANRLVNCLVAQQRDLATADRVLACMAEHSAVWQEEAAHKRAFLREYNDFEGQPLALFLAAEEESGYSRSTTGGPAVIPGLHVRQDSRNGPGQVSQESAARRLEELVEKYPRSRLADEALRLIAWLRPNEGREAAERRLFEQYPQSEYYDGAALSLLRRLTGIPGPSLCSLRRPEEQIALLSQYLQHRPMGALAAFFRARRGHLRLWAVGAGLCASPVDFAGAAGDLREALHIAEKGERVPVADPEEYWQTARNDLARITAELGESPAEPPTGRGGAPSQPEPLSADESSARAQRHLEAGRPLQALRLYRLALEKATDPVEQARLKLRLAELFRQASLPLEEVETWLQEIAETYRETDAGGEARFLIGEVQMARGEFTQAEQTLETMAYQPHLFPTHRDRALYLAGYAHERVERRTWSSHRGQDAYELLLREFPSSPWADWARFRLGCLKAAEGQREQAAAAYQQLLKRNLAPELRSEVLAALAYAQLERGNVEEAEKILLPCFAVRERGKGLGEEEPQSVPSVTAVAILLWSHQGENERVIQEGQRFLAAHPFHDYAADVGLARARALQSLQRTEEARQQLYQAAHAWPPFRLRQAIDKLGQALPPLPPPQPRRPTVAPPRWLLPELQDADGQALKRLVARFVEARKESPATPFDVSDSPTSDRPKAKAGSAAPTGAGSTRPADPFTVTNIEYDALKARAVVSFHAPSDAEHGGTGLLPAEGPRLEAVWRDGRWIATKTGAEWVA